MRQNSLELQKDKAIKAALHALEMVRDANNDEPHIPDVPLATINRAIKDLILAQGLCDET